MTDETVNLGEPADQEERKPDPGNSDPSAWTEPMTDEEQDEIRDLLLDHSANVNGLTDETPKEN